MTPSEEKAAAEMEAEWEVFKLSDSYAMAERAMSMSIGIALLEDALKVAWYAGLLTGIRSGRADAVARSHLRH